MKREFSNSSCVSGIGLVSANHIFVALKNEKFFEVYNIFTDHLVLRKELKKKAMIVRCNLHKQLVNVVDNLKNQTVLIGVVLEGGEVEVLCFKYLNALSDREESDFKDEKNNVDQISLEKVGKIQIILI